MQRQTASLKGPTLACARTLLPQATNTHALHGKPAQHGTCCKARQRNCKPSATRCGLLCRNLQQGELWGWLFGPHLYVNRPAVAAEIQVPRLQFVLEVAQTLISQTWTPHSSRCPHLTRISDPLAGPVQRSIGPCLRSVPCCAAASARGGSAEAVAATCGETEQRSCDYVHW